MQQSFNQSFIYTFFHSNGAREGCCGVESPTTISQSIIQRSIIISTISFIITVKLTVKCPLTDFLVTCHITICNVWFRPIIPLWVYSRYSIIHYLYSYLIVSCYLYNYSFWIILSLIYLIFISLRSAINTIIIYAHLLFAHLFIFTIQITIYFT